MATTEPAGSMSVDHINGLVNQGQFGSLQHQLQLQQQLLLSKQPQAAYAPAIKGDAPVHSMQHQQQYGAYDAAVFKQLAARQYTHRYQARDQGNAQHIQHDPADQQKAAQQQPANSLAGSAITGAFVSAPPAVTGTSQQLAQPPVFRTTAGPTAVLSAAIKQEPGSPTAHSPASSAPAAGNSSPTPELSAPPPEEQSGRASAAGGRFKLPAPSPLPPPDASEGPEAAAEYARYLERWEEGNTLAQRWYRLSERGVLADIVEEWEEWQHDRLLQGLQAQNKALARQPRKHKREEPEVDPDAPRQTRTRRVPQALQDYQVEAMTAGTPEPPTIVSGSVTAAVGTAATGWRAVGASGRPPAQQLHSAALEDAEMTYTEGAAGADASQTAHAPAHQATKLIRGPAAAPAGVKNQLLYNKVLAPGPQQQYSQQQQYSAPMYQEQPQRMTAPNAYSLAPQQARKPQQQARMGAYPDAGQAYECHMHNGQSAVGRNHWPAQAQQQQGYHSQQQQTNQQHGVGAYQQQQQHNGYHPGAVVPAASHDMMAQLLQMGSLANNSATAAVSAAAAGNAAASLPQALAAAAAALPAGIDYNAAFDAFTQVLGRVDPVAFTKHFTAAMQQSRQHQ